MFIELWVVHDAVNELVWHILHKLDHSRISWVLGSTFEWQCLDLER